VPSTERKHRSQLGHGIGAEHVLAEGHEVPLAVVADDVLAGVGEDRRLVELPRLLGVAGVDLAAEEQRAARRLERPHTAVLIAGERFERFGVAE
jgi:hypothetical protein